MSSLVDVARLSVVDNVGSDAEETAYVYKWRLQQEAALRAAKGSGMTDEQVINFVNGCKSMGKADARRNLPVLCSVVLLPRVMLFPAPH